MRTRMLMGVALTLCVSATVVAAPAHMPRHPAPSPDGSLVAFSWQGDIWVVDAGGGLARRLTAHPALDRYPVWSRDGQTLAFASDRFGNMDVFTMPSDASEQPKRLSHASVNDIPVDFTPDGAHIVFVSQRDESIRDSSAFYTVPVAGGTPALMQTALGRWGAWSPDGTRFAFVRGGTPWWRHGYRGSANRDLWLRDVDGQYRQLTEFEGDDDNPSWINGQAIAFLSERGGTKNVFVLDLPSGTVRQLSHHGDGDVRCPRVSSGGRLLTYEAGDAIWASALPDGPARRLDIQVATDDVRNPTEHKMDAAGASELALHPTLPMTAITVHGDIFLVPIMPKEDQAVAPPRTIRVTITAAREADLSWSPDGASMLFTSDSCGTRDLYLLRPVEGREDWMHSRSFRWQRLTESPEEEYAAQFSPDGTRIAFLRGRGDLMVMNSDGEEERRITACFLTPEFQWSPDGKWIAYSVSDEGYNSEIWIVSAGGGDPYNLSRHPDTDVSPRWSPDGRRLVWRSKRHADTQDVWGVWLTREDQQRRPEEWLSLWKREEDEPDRRAKTAKEDKKDRRPLPAVTIEFDGLWERAGSITSLAGDEGDIQVSPDGRRIVFTAEHQGERDLYSVRWDGKDLTRLTTGGQQPSMVQLDAEGQTVFYLAKGGAVKRIGLDGKARDPVPFQARYRVDHGAQMAQVFDEAWRLLHLWFYDPGFHGTDWRAQRDRYRPLALSASHEEDFADAIRLMLGELNTSHVWYSSPRSDGGETTGWIGTLFDPGAGGPGIAIREVLPQSPAAELGVDLRPGDRIVTVRGVPIQSTTNVYSLFTNTIDEPVHLEILTSEGTTRDTMVRPVHRDEARNLRYREWVRQRRALVDQHSQGRIGYVHVRGMSTPSFEEFERDLYAAAHGKDALIVDVRSNGGGWTTDYLLAVLNVRRHAYTLAPGLDPSTRAYPQVRLPLSAWTRPAVAICDEESFSNAEIFSHAFKTLGRGLLIGNRTFGGVISTGSADLLNGGRVSLPGRGWFVADTGEPMENNGAIPDIVVLRPPAEDLASDRDSQLEKAVGVLLETMQDDPRYGAW